MPDTTCERIKIYADNFTLSVKQFLERQLQLDDFYGIVPEDQYFPGFPTYEPILQDPEPDDIKSLPDTRCRSSYGMINIKTGDYTPMPCKSWKCGPCAKAKKFILYLRMKGGQVKDWVLKTHVVLTVQSQEADKKIDYLFNRLIICLRRGMHVRASEDEFWVDSDGKKHKKIIIIDKDRARDTDRFIWFPNIKYLWVKEFQFERFLKTGLWFRHLHVIFNDSISLYDIIPIWNYLTNVDFNYIYSRPVFYWDNGKYLIKYLCKQEYQAQFEDGENRYGASKGVLRKIKNKDKTGDYHFDKLEIIRELHYQYKMNPERFKANFDKILYLTKMKERFIRTNAADNFTVLNI